ncbi:MAG: matrixin family metalloprotease, partial [Kangiellaceae bacterium]|nr:matrixin family metalloprotease [Kangiellaceae bacterium]
RESLIRSIEKKWANQTVLHYHFLDNPAQWRGSSRQKDAARRAFAEWKGLGIGLEFEEVQDAEEAELRIGFEQGSGSWSYVGRDNVVHAVDPAERTMNFGWDLTTPYGADTALHEIGHAIGFPHEHQNPNSGIKWNEAKVIEHFSGAPNFWTPDKIRWNILRKLNAGEVEGSRWDKDSIMHYQFDSGLIIEPPTYRTNPLIPAAGLSQTDIDEVRKFYPAVTTRIPQLRPFESQLVSIEPGEQLDFKIEPRWSGRYTIQTFGKLDTVMVLFEERNGEPRYIAGDDDSGRDYNAKIKERLTSGRTYYLRVRLYYSQSQGAGAVMMW